MLNKSLGTDNIECQILTNPVKSSEGTSQVGQHIVGKPIVEVTGTRTQHRVIARALQILDADGKNCAADHKQVSVSAITMAAPGSFVGKLASSVAVSQARLYCQCLHDRQSRWHTA